MNTPQRITFISAGRTGNLLRANGGGPQRLLWADVVNLSDINQPLESSFTVVPALNKNPRAVSFLGGPKDGAGNETHCLRFFGPASTPIEGRVHLGPVAGVDPDLASFFLVSDSPRDQLGPKFVAVQSAKPGWESEFWYVRHPSEGNVIARHAPNEPPNLTSLFWIVPGRDRWPGL
jgi:hypothetical protein